MRADAKSLLLPLSRDRGSGPSQFSFSRVIQGICANSLRLAALPAHHLFASRIYPLSFASFATLRDLPWFSPSCTLIWRYLGIDLIKIRRVHPDSLGSFRIFDLAQLAVR
jgi:hypothetical protein